MGLILDLVPNHMCIDSFENRWWNEVLENGRSSVYAGHFDIDWAPPKADLADKVLLPVLGDQYGRVLENQEIQIVRDGGTFSVRYYDHRFPVAPKAWTQVLEPALLAVRGRLGESDPRVLELESIVTAINHLPLRTETGPEKVQERAREKEIIKRRLGEIIESSEAVREAVDASLVELNGRRGDPRSFDRLEALLADEAYRLSYWRVATDEINYRRFFDINELAAIRVEEPPVFDALHALPFRLLEEGWVTGLRIDHVDGLFDPADYLARLPGDAYVVVEKILIGDERLRSDWPVQGTTGYEVLNGLNAVFVDEAAGPTLLDLYARFTGNRDAFADVVYECKKLVLEVALSSELTVLARRLDRVSEQHRFSRDFTLNSLQDGLGEVIACFPVYRSYVRAQDGQVGPEDRRHILRAVRLAKRRNPAISATLFDFISSVLLLEDPEGLDEMQRAERRDFVMRFQQLTGPVMAKGLEDTASYRFHPLASLNDVGGEADSFGTSVERFHLENLERSRSWPHGLSSSSTHDTKRDEDVRARIDVLTEVPEGWERAVFRWRELNRDRKVLVEDAEVPDANEEYLFYQTLFGTWPVGSPAAAEPAAYGERIQGYMLKAVREAKLHTSWINADEAYERAVREFVDAVLDPRRGRRFLEDFAGFQERLLGPGLLNSVSQTLLKIAAPGVPDFYQGTELWEFHLVDPDNRRPVDFERRRLSLDALAREAEGDAAGLAERLLAGIEDGRLKLYVTSRALGFRRSHRRLFDGAEYVPLSAGGRRRRHVVAFARTGAGEAVVAAAARFFVRLPAQPVGSRAWGDSALRLADDRASAYRDVFTGREITASRGGGGYELPLASVFAHLPVALLERVS
jgi:(1->4)-alpha-D-glucan 1-alpha-D-glucosylmutase